MKVDGSQYGTYYSFGTSVSHEVVKQRATINIPLQYLRQINNGVNATLIGMDAEVLRGTPFEYMLDLRGITDNGTLLPASNLKKNLTLVYTSDAFI